MEPPERLAAAGGEEDEQLGDHPARARPASAGRIARNTVIQSLAIVVSHVATLAFLVVLARELGQAEFGDFTFALSIGVLVTVAALGTDYAIMQEVARHREVRGDTFGNALALRFVIGTAALGLAVAVAAVGGYGSEVVAATALLGGAAWLDVLARTMQAALRGLEEMAPIAAAWVIQRLVTAIGGALIVLATGALVAACVAYLVGSLVGLAYTAAILFGRHARPGFAASWARARSLITVSLPLAVGNAMVLVLARLDVVILSQLKSNAEVGTYGAAYRLFEGTSLFSSIFGLSAYPALSRLDRTTSPTIGAAYEIGCKGLLLLLAPVGLGFSLFAQPVIELLYGSEYDGSVSVLRLLGPAVPLWALFVFSVFVLAAVDRQRAVGVVLALGVALNVALNLVLIPPFGADGSAAAMTLSLGSIVTVLIVLAVSRTGPLRPVRIAAAALLGSSLIALIFLTLGGGLVAIPIAAVAYAGAALLVERRWFPDDLAFMLRTFRRAASRGAPADRPASTAI